MWIGCKTVGGSGTLPQGNYFEGIPSETGFSSLTDIPHSAALEGENVVGETFIVRNVAH